MDDDTGERPALDIVLEVLGPLGVQDALERALRTASLDALPRDAVSLSEFLGNELTDELVGLIHPTSALRAVSEIRALLASSAESGLRTRPGPITARPPPTGEIAEMYSSLSNGEIHTRKTPVWGVPAVRDERVGNSAWILVSRDEMLIGMAEAAVPAGVDVVVASSLAVLKETLERGSGALNRVVLDATAPSIPLEETLTALTAEEAQARVIVWRVRPELRLEVLDSIPEARRWLTCDPEVTRDELIRLLSI